MSSLKMIRSLFFTAIVILAFLDPNLVTTMFNALALYCVSLLQKIADSLNPTEESLLARAGTFVLLIFDVVLQLVMQMLQIADRITKAAGKEAGQNFRLHGQDEMRVTLFLSSRSSSNMSSKRLGD